MFENKTKRQRQLTFAIISGVAFVIILIAVFWIGSNGEEKYVPGSDISGLTSDLARDLPEDYPKVIFTDVSKTAGIRFNHFQGTRTVQLPEDMGSGAAWADYDNDGWMDLFIANFAGPLSLSREEILESSAKCALYHNNTDGTFTEVGSAAGLDISTLANAAAWGDFDNDGWVDLVITTYGENVFYKNNGDGSFQDISLSSGISGYEGFWAGASWADYNKDGYLDLYICGYVEYSYQDNSNSTLQYNTGVPSSINPSSFPSIPNLLFQNNGDGTFSEISKNAGVENVNGKSLAAAWCDFDEDGWPDLYVANDVSDNAFYRNLGNGKFDEVSHSSFVADYRGAMGIAIADWDGDSDMDMFITHWMAQENALFNNTLARTRLLHNSKGEARFMDEADRYGLGQVALEYIGFGTNFIDYDNDGRQDLFIANGSTFQQPDSSELLIPMNDQIFWNRGLEEGFFDVSPVSGDYFSKEYVGRGSAHADYDNDGDLDLIIVNNGGPAILLENSGEPNHSWLKIKLSGNRSNSMGIGATVTIITGDKVQTKQIGAQGSYLSQNSMIQHFGLGKDNSIDTLKIIWPLGERQLFTNVLTNQIITIEEGDNQLKY